MMTSGSATPKYRTGTTSPNTFEHPARNDTERPVEANSCRMYDAPSDHAADWPPHHATPLLRSTRSVRLVSRGRSSEGTHQTTKNQKPNRSFGF